MQTTTKPLDVLIIGAGLSGVGTACHIAREFPDKTIALIERRKTLGGTWDLFRYPGIASRLHGRSRCITVKIKPCC